MKKKFSGISNVINQSSKRYILKPSQSLPKCQDQAQNSHTSGVAVSRFLHTEPFSLKQEAQMLP